jgi:hypothetical protein
MAPKAGGRDAVMPQAPGVPSCGLDGEFDRRRFIASGQPGGLAKSGLTMSWGSSTFTELRIVSR